MHYFYKDSKLVQIKLSVDTSHPTIENWSNCLSVRMTHNSQQKFQLETSSPLLHSSRRKLATLSLLFFQNFAELHTSIAFWRFENYIWVLCYSSKITVLSTCFQRVISIRTLQPSRVPFPRVIWFFTGIPTSQALWMCLLSSECPRCFCDQSFPPGPLCPTSLPNKLSPHG